MARDEHSLVPVAPRGRVEIASDINEARADQLVALDGEGNVTSMRAVMVRSLPFAVIAGAAIGGGLAISTAVAGAMALPLVGLLFGGWLIYLRDAQAIRHSAELIAQDRLEEASVRVHALEKRWSPYRSLRGYVAGHAAAISWRRGNLKAALAHTERALEQLGRTRFRRASPVYWMQLLNRVQLLAGLGRLDEAEEGLGTAGGAPPGDWLAMEQAFTHMHLAFCRNDHTRLPEELHPWVTAALRTNVFGGNVVLLAWAYDQRGDSDMAAHLVGESESRLQRWHLDRTFPEVWRWLEGARARLFERAV